MIVAYHVLSMIDLYLMVFVRYQPIVSWLIVTSHMIIMINDKVQHIILMMVQCMIIIMLMINLLFALEMNHCLLMIAAYEPSR